MAAAGLAKVVEIQVLSTASKAAAEIRTEAIVPVQIRIALAKVAKAVIMVNTSKARARVPDLDLSWATIQSQEARVPCSRIFTVSLLFFRLETIKPKSFVIAANAISGKPSGGGGGQSGQYVQGGNGGHGENGSGGGFGNTGPNGPNGPNSQTGSGGHSSSFTYTSSHGSSTHTHTHEGVSSAFSSKTDHFHHESNRMSNSNHIQCSIVRKTNETCRRQQWPIRGFKSGPI